MVYATTILVDMVIPTCGDDVENDDCLAAKLPKAEAKQMPTKAPPPGKGPTTAKAQTGPPPLPKVPPPQQWQAAGRRKASTPEVPLPELLRCSA